MLIMALWIPGPWGSMDGKPLPETPHQAAIAQDEPVKKPRKPRTPKTEA